MPVQRPILSVDCKSQSGRTPWQPHTSLHLYHKKVTAACPAGGIEEFSVPNSTWHFSYFGSAERYRAKMFAANVAEGSWGSSASKGEGTPFETFVSSALQCRFPWKGPSRSLALSPDEHNGTGGGRILMPSSPPRAARYS